MFVSFKFNYRPLFITYTKNQTALNFIKIFDKNIKLNSKSYTFYRNFEIILSKDIKWNQILKENSYVKK